jgi:hypothetical protein
MAARSIAAQVALLALILLLRAPSVAQTAAAPDTFAPIKLGDIIFTGNLRSRFYGWDWFQPASGDNNYVYSGNLLRLGLSQNRNRWAWNAEFGVPFLLGLPSNANGTGPQQGALGFGANYFTANRARNTAMVFPKQLYVRFNSLARDQRQSLQIGRFEFLDGGEVVPKDATLSALKRDRVNARLIGNFGFTDVGRSFDGLHYTYATSADNFTIVTAVPTRGVFQVDGWGWNNVAFGYFSYTHSTSQGRHSSDSRLFLIEYDDWRRVLKSDNRPLAVRRGDLSNIRIETVRGHTLQSFYTSAGTVDLLLWGAGQTGRWGIQEQRAGAFDVEAGIQPRTLPKLRPWLRGGYYWGSGDGNPNDNIHGTFFQVLPTPRPFARFPFFNMMNNDDAFGMLILRPHDKVTVSSGFHSLRLANVSDAWYTGGGVYQPWTFGYSARSAAGARSLANLYDTNVEFRANRNLTLTAYFGYAQGLAVIEQIYPSGRTARLGYLEALWRF